MVEPGTLLGQLIAGAAEEMEHTTDRRVAVRIALDHLAEDRGYYTKLKGAGLMEGKDMSEMEVFKAGLSRVSRCLQGVAKAALPEGTVRQRRDGQYRKVGGEWVKVPSKAGGKAKGGEDDKAFMERVKTTTAGMTVDQRREYMSKHPDEARRSTELKRKAMADSGLTSSKPTSHVVTEGEQRAADHARSQGRQPGVTPPSKPPSKPAPKAMTNDQLNRALGMPKGELSKQKAGTTVRGPLKPDGTRDTFRKAGNDSWEALGPTPDKPKGGK